MFQSIHDWMAFDQEQVTPPSDMDGVPETGGCLKKVSNGFLKENWL